MQQRIRAMNNANCNAVADVLLLLAAQPSYQLPGCLLLDSPLAGEARTDQQFSHPELDLTCGAHRLCDLGRSRVSAHSWLAGASQRHVPSLHACLDHMAQAVLDESQELSKCCRPASGHAAPH